MAGYSRNRMGGIGVALVLAAYASFSTVAAGPRASRAQSIERPRVAQVPNDFLYVLQWNLHDAQGIRMPVAWDVSTGAGVRVAVLDTGIVPHPELGANIVAGYDFVSDATNAADGNGRDANPTDPGVAGGCAPLSDPLPSSFHGTALAGIIAADTNDGSSIAGIAYGAKVVPVRVLGKCGGTVADVADAIRWASGGTVAGVPTIVDPVEVIALSYTRLSACDPTLQTAIDSAVAAGVVVVAGAGNHQQNAAASQPGNCANVINVAGLARIGMRAGYSNYGPAVDVAAPGGTAEDFGFGVYATGFHDGNLSSVGAPEITGTQAAMAHVAGVAALMQAVKVNSPAVVEAILKRTALPTPLPCPEGCGAGIIDASVAVRAAARPVVFITPPTNVVEGEAGTAAANFRVRLSQPLDVPLMFDLATANGTATAVNDFVPRNVTGQVIPAGQTEYAFPVLVKGEDLAEANETFHVDIANVVGAEVFASRATTTIQTDDCFPLANGVPLTGLSGAVGSAACFVVDVPPYSGPLTITTSPAGAGADTYVRRYEMPDPRGGYWDYDCYSSSCRLFGTGTYYVLLQGRSAYSGVTLSASFVPPPVPDLSVADVSIVEEQEGTRNLRFTVQLSSGQHADITLDVATSDLGATAGSDYDALVANHIVIPAGAELRYFNVPIHGDADIEANESFRLDLANVVGANVIDGSAIGTIFNDDGPLLRVGDVIVKEGDAGTKLATFTVGLNTPASTPVLFDIATRDGTATAGSDYVALALAGEAIPAGQLARTFSVTILGDTTLEPNERIHLDLVAISSASAVDASGYIDIQNDEGPTLSVLDTSVREGDSGSNVMQVTVRLSQPATVPVSYQLVTVHGSSEYYDLTDHAVTLYGNIGAGLLTKVHTILIQGDRNIEADETVHLELRNVVGVSAYDWRGVGTILNDDGPALYVRNAGVTEGNDGSRVATFVVALSQAMAVPISYSISTSDGTAQAGSDYVARTLVGETIPAGMSSRTFTVAVNGDTGIEGTETFSATVFDVGPGATAWNPTGTGYILNDDGPALSVLDASVVEGHSGTRTMTVTVRLSEPASTPVTYSLATSAGTASSFDFAALNLVDQVMPAGETVRTHAITVNGDTALEANETILVMLGAVNGATRLDWQAVATIVNDDGPTLSVQNSGITEGNYGTKVATFVVTLSQAATVPVSYSIATGNGTAVAGGDFVGNSLAGETITAGMLSRTFEVVVNGDLVQEGNETFNVSIANASGATIYRPQATGTITDND